MACCKNCFKIFTLILCFVDIGVGWFKFYQLYDETQQLEQTLQGVDPALRNDCPDPQLYWKLYVTFEAIGTILCVFEIYYLIMEIYKDKRMFDKCFSRAWFLVVAIYVFEIFPSGIVDIIYRDRCICHEGFSFSAWEADVRDFFRGFLGGASVICLSIILHLTDIYVRLRRLLTFVKTYVFCMKFVPNEDEEWTCCERTHICFAISTILALCYTALFVTQIVFIFCEKYD